MFTVPHEMIVYRESLYIRIAKRGKKKNPDKVWNGVKDPWLVVVESRLTNVESAMCAVF